MLSASDTLSPVLPAPRLHAFTRLLIATIGAVVLSFLVSLVIISATAVAASLSGQDANAQIEKFFSENFLLVNLFVYPPILLWLWICRRLLDRRTFVSLGLRAKGIAGQFSSGILCGFLAVALIFGVLLLSGNLRINGISVAVESAGWQKSLLMLCGWAAMMLCVGLFEEIAFRGYAFHNLNHWLGTRAANVLQAIVFALIHLGNLAAQGQSNPDATLAAFLALPNIFLIGIFFTLCYFKTGSLWFPIAFHAAWNFFMGCVFSLPVSGLPIFQLFEVSVTGIIPVTGGAFGPEASLLLTPILLVMIFVVSRSRDSVQAIADLQSLEATAASPVEEDSYESAFPHDMEPISDGPRENRFKTRMGQRQSDLDEETRHTLELLNKSRRESSRLPEKVSPFGPILVEPAPAQPVPVQATPVQATPVETQQTAIPPTASTPVETTFPSPEKKPSPGVASPVAAPAPPPPTPDTPSTPATPTRPKPKPTPRW